MKPEKKLWFRAKRYGYGWYPATSEGWAVMGAFLILAVLGAYFFKSSMLKADGNTVIQVTSAFIIYYTSLIALLIRICIARGEPARWRWGKDS